MTKVEIVQGNIITFAADAIVNAANEHLQAGGGVCGAIFKASDAPVLQAECDSIVERLGNRSIGVGNAAITSAPRLGCNYIIHAVGPIYSEYPTEVARKHLADAYVNSLKLAVRFGCKSVVFPTISTGIYGFPLEDACRIAYTACKLFSSENDLTVYLIAYDDINLKALNDAKTVMDSELSDHP